MHPTSPLLPSLLIIRALLRTSFDICLHLHGKPPNKELNKPHLPITMIAMPAHNLNGAKQHLTLWIFVVKDCFEPGFLILTIL